MAEERTLGDLTRGWYVGPEFMGGWPIYLPDGRHFATVSRAPGIDAEQCARQMAASSDLLAVAQRWAALDAGSWHVERHAAEKRELIEDTRAAIKRATEG